MMQIIHKISVFLPCPLLLPTPPLKILHKILQRVGLSALILGSIEHTHCAFGFLYIWAHPHGLSPTSQHQWGKSTWEYDLARGFKDNNFPFGLAWIGIRADELFCDSVTLQTW